mmetsp:Transcript_14996/g.27902  ORF Transcript_14996/g.27902 Transcript_14996/m.27902 type:complete len:237 (-) Transcript_14996:1045-1755(-)
MHFSLNAVVLYVFPNATVNARVSHGRILQGALLRRLYFRRLKWRWRACSARHLVPLPDTFQSRTRRSHQRCHEQDSPCRRQPSTCHRHKPNTTPPQVDLDISRGRRHCSRSRCRGSKCRRRRPPNTYPRRSQSRAQLTSPFDTVQPSRPNSQTNHHALQPQRRRPLCVSQCHSQRKSQPRPNPDISPSRTLGSRSTHRGQCKWSHRQSNIVPHHNQNSFRRRTGLGICREGRWSSR